MKREKIVARLALTRGERAELRAWVKCEVLP
jgi:hypothetical protein